jgi:hypothetical protein
MLRLRDQHALEIARVERPILKGAAYNNPAFSAFICGYLD